MLSLPPVAFSGREKWSRFAPYINWVTRPLVRGQKKSKSPLALRRGAAPLNNPEDTNAHALIG